MRSLTENMKNMGVEYLRKLVIRKDRLDNLYKNIEKIYPIEPETLATPEAKELPFFDYTQHLQSETISSPHIYSAVINNIIYCPKHEIILSKSRTVISDAIGVEKGISISGLYLNKVVDLKGIYAVFRSTKSNLNYYHTLIDNIPRLYLLAKAVEPEQEVKLLFSSEPNPVESYFIDKILPKNFKVCVVNKSKLFNCEKFIYATFMNYRDAGYLPSAYIDFFIKKVAPARPRNQVNRIFISRPPQTLGERRCILNESELFNILEKYGFKRYILEEIPIDKQIEIFYDAEYVVAPHGAGLSNLIFANKIKLVELFPTRSISPYYYYLAKAMGHSYKHLSSNEPHLNANFSVNIPELVKIFDSLAIQTDSN